MKGVLVILTAADPARLRSALTLAAATRALGAPAQVFLHEEAAALALDPQDADADAARRSHGLPDLREAWDTAIDLGTEVIACQTGLAIAGIDASALDPRIRIGGLIGVMATGGDDHLIML